MESQDGRLVGRDRGQPARVPELRQRAVPLEGGLGRNRRTVGRCPEGEQEPGG
jgi:hypothetical protein